MTWLFPRLQQTKQAKEKAHDDVYEMNKPLARYKDDEDLDAMMKDRDRAGDPMLAFLQKKKVQQDVVSGKKGIRPTTMGSANIFLYLNPLKLLFLSRILANNYTNLL